jgi:hypothetical protein
MLRCAIAALVVATLAGSSAWAETYGDKVKEVDVDKKTLTLPVEGKDRVFTVDAAVDVKNQRRVGKRLTVTPAKDGLKAVKVGSEITVTTEKKDGKEVVTKIVILVPEAK